MYAWTACACMYVWTTCEYTYAWTTCDCMHATPCVNYACMRELHVLVVSCTYAWTTCACTYVWTTCDCLYAWLCVTYSYRGGYFKGELPQAIAGAKNKKSGCSKNWVFIKINPAFLSLTLRACTSRLSQMHCRNSYQHAGAVHANS